MRSICLLTLLALAFALGACGDDTTTEPGTEPTPDADVEDVTTDEDGTEDTDEEVSDASDRGVDGD